MQDAMTTIRELDQKEIESRIQYLEGELLGWKIIRALKRVIEATDKLPQREASEFLPTEDILKKLAPERLINKRDNIKHEDIVLAFQGWVQEHSIELFTTSMFTDGLLSNYAPQASLYHLNLLEKAGTIVKIKHVLRKENRGFIWIVRNGADPDWLRTHYANANEEDIDKINGKA